MIQMQTFLRNGNQQVGRYGDPYLRLDRVLAGTEEHLDAQVSTAVGFLANLVSATFRPPFAAESADYFELPLS